MFSEFQGIGDMNLKPTNVFFVFQGIGDMNLAYQCFRLTLANNNDHAEAYNNLGVLELRKGNVDMVSQYFFSGQSILFCVFNLYHIIIQTGMNIFTLEIREFFSVLVSNSTQSN